MLAGGGAMVPRVENVNTASIMRTIMQTVPYLLHCTLEIISAMYLKSNSSSIYPWQCVPNEQVNHQQVSTFLTAGNVKFMLLHGGKNEDSIKNFFNDVYELYVKLLMNPFYAYDTPITSKAFDTRVRAIARRYLS